MNRKGQALVLEEVMMIGAGVMLLGGMIVTFGALEDYSRNEIQENQLEEVSNYIIASIIELKAINCDECSIVLEIPILIGDETYIISGHKTLNKLIVYNSNNIYLEDDIPLRAEGLASSNTGKIQVEYIEDDPSPYILIRPISYY